MAIEPQWDDPSLRVASDSARTARYRRLQSWYREVRLGLPPGRSASGQPVGSMLREVDVHDRPGLNFLDPAAHDHATTRAAEVQTEGGTLEVERLRHNLLSSMPLCFNLFGALRTPERADSYLALFRELFDPAAIAITDTICEWRPSDPAQRIGDRTAFDAVVIYERADGPAVLGIETKYTEPFSQKAYDLPRYHEVTAACGWFRDGVGAPARLKAPASNQLWRNLMLAAAIDLAGERRSAVAVVALSGDPGASKAITAVRAELHDGAHDRLVQVDLEAIVAAVPSASPSLQPWAERFGDRYLHPDRV